MNFAESCGMAQTLASRSKYHYVIEERRANVRRRYLISKGAKNKQGLRIAVISVCKWDHQRASVCGNAVPRELSPITYICLIEESHRPNGPRSLKTMISASQ